MEDAPLFISYSRADIGLVRRIKDDIENHTGAKCWMDLKSIVSGSKSFTKDIIDGINNCEVFLFMLSENSQRSEFALRELDFADKKGKRVVIVNINDCAMTDEFQFLYGLSDTISWNDVLQHDKLLRDLKLWHHAQSDTGQEIGSGSGHASHEEELPQPQPDHEPAQPVLSAPKGKTRMVKALVLSALGAVVAGAVMFCFLHPIIGSKDVLFPYREGGYIGFMDKTGATVIEALYQGVFSYEDYDDRVWAFSDGLAAVKMNEKWGYINSKGEFQIPAKFFLAEPFSEGMAFVLGEEGGRWDIIDKQGRYVTRVTFEKHDPFSEGMAVVQVNGKYGFINKEGDYVIDPIYDDARSFSEGLAAVKSSEGWGYIDKNGNYVIQPKYDNADSFSEGLAAVGIGEKWGFINKKGDDVIPAKYDRVGAFHEGLAFVMPSVEAWEWGAIDKTGGYVFSPQYDNASPFSEGLAAVEYDGYWGFVDKTGEIAVPAIYIWVFSYWNGVALACDGRNVSYINKRGETIKEFPMEYQDEQE